jgi:LmbE family N-acetylglucosaminyl deacetylase
MKRRRILKAVSTGAAQAVAQSETAVVVRGEPGQPHQGKVLVAVHAHLDDIPYHASGLCAKLMSEGYTGYIVRTSNDEKFGGRSTAENILSNEQDHYRMAAALGFKDVFDFYYQNHEMNGISYLDLRGRLILIFRMLKADTVISFNPWGQGEEDPDHWVTGYAVEEACWMAACPRFYDTWRRASNRARTERYYVCADRAAVQPRGRYRPHVEKKIDAIVECKSGDGNRDRSSAQLVRQGAPTAYDDDRRGPFYARHFS